MTVSHYGESVRIVDGDPKEGWALIEYEEGERRTVPLGELKAGDPTEEIYERLDDLTDPASDGGVMAYTQHLPLHIDVGKREVLIRTNNGEILFEEDPGQTADRSGDEWEVADEAMRALQMVDRAHTQPKRLLYQRQDELLEVEA